MNLEKFEGNKTISSLEIAELTEKLHKNVLADVDNMLTALELHSADFSAQYKDVTGRSLRCYNLPKRESLILASGYNVRLRAAIIDRWAELEAKEQTKIPQSFAEALQLAADQAKQLELQAPKVQFADNILATDSSISVANMAKLIGLGQNKLFEKLRNDRILMSGGQRHNVPYQKHIDSGNFEVTEQSWVNSAGNGLRFITRVTTKGQQYIVSKYGK